MINLKNILLMISVLVLVSSCSDDHDHEADILNEEEDEHVHHINSVTQYTDASEIFMEYPALLINKEAGFLIHLTNIADFKAVTEGQLKINFISESGNKLTIVEEKPVRDGIYIPKVTFREPGVYKMILDLSGKQLSDQIIVEDIDVHVSHDELHKHDESEEEHPDGISFLKEQQWKIYFANEEVVLRKMQGSVSATGEILEKPELYSKVISPAEGVILNKNNKKIFTVGEKVKKGETLVVISASADANTNLQKIKNDYLLAKAEYERVERLFEKKAISEKRLFETRLEYESKKISHKSILDQIEIVENGYAVIAPIDGHIESINFDLGDQISSGQELYSILNPSRIILKANVPSVHSAAADNSTDACFLVEGFLHEYRISNLNGTKLTTSVRLNKSNRTIPAYFEFDNPDNKIKVGMFADVHVKIGEEQEYVTIPEKSIVNEDGLETAYIQVEGEMFEKRIVETGIRDEGYVQIINGIKPGERVVTEGAYIIRLASLAPESAIGHGHVH
ncbi:MAG: efflux RND transporter periplasmic adaptor subunit [Melioribacteraceae bacterium]|nr:efflux RND transporter periplasmic adaptor subunit [Melioribacteraceae bacterium]